MEKHKMKLMTEYFDYILNGSKRIELRLNDEKRKNIAINDEIVFEELKENPRYLKTKVINLYYEKSFDNLINKFDVKKIGDKKIKKEDILHALNSIYSVEKQKEYGVVGIEIELLDEK